MSPRRQSPPGGDALADRLTDHLGVCVIDLARGAVEHQNQLCKAICGEQCGGPCSRKEFRYCANLGLRDDKFEGMSLSRCERGAGGEYFDVTMIRSNESEVILLYPLKERLAKEEAVFEQSVLTDKELSIVKLVLRRRSNQQICGELDISANTLRTHLKNIYRKASPAGAELLKSAREAPEA